MADHDAHDHTGVPGVGTSIDDILDLTTAETDDTLVLAPDGAGGVEFRAEAGGVGGGGFTQDVNQDGTSFASWTSVAGTWASNGTLIQQTNAAASDKSARLTAKMTRAISLFEAEIRFPTTGQPAAPNYAGLILGMPAGSSSGVPAVYIERNAASLVHFGHLGGSPVLDVSVTIALDTFYKLRALWTGGNMTVWLDGTLLGTAQDLGVSGDRTYLGLLASGAVVDYRNIKAWSLTLPA